MKPLIDPNSTIPMSRESRVRERKSVRSPFVAPELSPVSTIDAEREKRSKGWTDPTAVVVVLDNKTSHLPKGAVERALGEMKVGVVYRKAPISKARPVSTTGPSASYRAKQARAARRGR
ncbi:hypothetical protein MycrhDRAFT_5729 [Mycolicibacterium rhodesiae JS60]|nr:hypothetical protein MycrhDRAFT_5729 [Mycolicibacterium rhodesiae JS60]